MVRGPVSISDLKKLLSQREDELAKLTKKRGQLAKELAQVDEQIAALSGGAPKPAPAPVARKRRTLGKRKPMVKRAGKLTLRAATNRVLAGGGTMTAEEIHVKLPSTGYKSASPNVGNMLRQLLYKCEDFRRVSRGKYALKK